MKSQVVALVSYTESAGWLFPGSSVKTLAKQERLDDLMTCQSSRFHLALSCCVATLHISTSLQPRLLVKKRPSPIFAKRVAFVPSVFQVMDPGPQEGSGSDGSSSESHGPEATCSGDESSQCLACLQAFGDQDQEPGSDSWELR